VVELYKEVLVGVNVAVIVEVPTPLRVAVGVEELAKLATEVSLEL